jgi:Zn-finger nucleic acid-binding protein
MACPTCGHTLQTAFADGVRVIRYCPRCGTMRNELGEHVDDTTPKLVDRCREFGAAFGFAGVPDGHLWKQLGIAESIAPPSERRKT